MVFEQGRGGRTEGEGEEVAATARRRTQTTRGRITTREGEEEEKMFSATGRIEVGGWGGGMRGGMRGRCVDV